MGNELQVTRDTFSKIEPLMVQAGFKPEDVKREISFAVQHINKSAQLQKCTGESKLQAVLNISNIGLSLNPAAKEAYLIPRWNNTSKQMEATLEPGYIGLTKLLTDSGSVVSILSQLVYSGDVFTLDIANNKNPISHKPELIKSKRGEIIGAYALATLPDGSRQSEWMDLEEIEYIRGRSETYKAYVDKKISTCTWVTDFGEMARKTVVKRIYKYLPRTDRMKFMDEAVQVDNQDYMASNDQLAYIESLLLSSTLEERQRGQIEMEMTVMSGQRASQVIEQLQQNQQGMDHGNLGTQKAISKHIEKIAAK